MTRHFPTAPARSWTSGARWLSLPCVAHAGFSGVLCCSQVDLYERLDLQPEASDRDIKSAYRKMSVKYHPDKNPGNEVRSARPLTRVGRCLHSRKRAASRALRDAARRGTTRRTRPLTGVRATGWRRRGAQAKFREITEAYEILSDKEKRVIYDFNGIGAVRKMGQGDQGGGCLLYTSPSPRDS